MKVSTSGMTGSVIFPFQVMISNSSRLTHLFEGVVLNTGNHIDTILCLIGLRMVYDGKAT